MECKTICLDWLSISAKGNIKLPETNDDSLKLSNEMYLIPVQKSTNHYRRMFKIIFEGVEFATLLFEPVRNYVDPSRLQIDVKNERLYESEMIDRLELIMQTLAVEFSHIIRLDVAVDGLGLLKPLLDADAGKIQRVGKGDVTLRKTAGGELKACYVGSKSSNKMLVGYNKSNEIKRSNKAYIKQFWMNSGFWESESDYETVERLEMRLKRKELVRYEETEGIEGLRRLADPDFLKKLFKSTIKGVYQFVEAGVRKDRAKEVRVLRLLKAGHRTLEKVAGKIVNEVYRAKMAIRTMWEVGHLSGLFRYEMMAKELADNIDHGVWFDKTWEKWKEGVRRRKKRNEQIKYENKTSFNKKPLLYQYITDFVEASQLNQLTLVHQLDYRNLNVPTR